VINEMVDQFQREAVVKFTDRDALERSLFFHIKSAYYRIIHGIEFENPLAETIMNNYSRLFLLTKRVIPHLEDVIGESISNDELALITMHFGGWIEKDSKNAHHL
jgi:transcriptional antiterminator